MNSKFKWKGAFFDKKETKRGPNLPDFDIIWQEKSPKGKKSPKGDLVFHPVIYILFLDYD